MRLRLPLALVLAGCLLLAAGMVLLAQAAHAQDGPEPRHSVLVFLRLPPEHFSPQDGYGGGYGGGGPSVRLQAIAEARARANGLTLADHWPMPMLGLDCYVMQVPQDRPLDETAQTLSRQPDIEWAEPMQTYAAQGGTGDSDPLYRTQPDAVEWHLDALHRIATGRNITIAVIDSAIDARHPDLTGRVAVSRNFVTDRDAGPEKHGTGVAGIIAAVAGNGKGIVGVAPDARLMSLRACWQQADGTVCDTLSLAKALYFAIDRRADVINMSLAGPDDRLLGSLLDLAQRQGITIVGAVDPGLPDGGFPASHKGVVAVIDEDGTIWNAAFGAPGRDVPTTEPGNTWSVVSGSSFAAAHVSGLFALIRERSRKPEPASVLVTGAGNAIDPCATLRRWSAAACPSGTRP